MLVKLGRLHIRTYKGVPNWSINNYSNHKFFGDGYRFRYSICILGLCLDISSIKETLK